LPIPSCDQGEFLMRAWLRDQWFIFPTILVAVTSLVAYCCASNAEGKRWEQRRDEFIRQCQAERGFTECWQIWNGE